MIHHVKQKPWLNLNANAVDASVHSNVTPTTARLGRRFQLMFSILQNFLPGSLFTPVSTIIHLRRLPGCYFPHQVVWARHLPPIITSLCRVTASTCPLLNLLRKFSLGLSLKISVSAPKTSASRLLLGYFALWQLWPHPHSKLTQFNLISHCKVSHFHLQCVIFGGWVLLVHLSVNQTYTHNFSKEEPHWLLKKGSFLHWAIWC